jgi:hypothetical protein
MHSRDGARPVSTKPLYLVYFASLKYAEETESDSNGNAVRRRRIGTQNSVEKQAGDYRMKRIERMKTDFFAIQNPKFKLPALIRTIQCSKKMHQTLSVCSK